MSKAFAIGATGMQAHQKGVDSIADNIANANTPGFKKSRVGFVDLMVQEGASANRSADPASPTMAFPGGVSVGQVTKLFDAGDLRKTDVPLDLAIEGEGFFAVALVDGGTAYTRGGSLKVNKDGLLSAPSGEPLRPAIRIPEHAKAIAISRDGRVMVTMPHSSAPVEAGQIELSRFANPSGLVPAGDGLYRASPASGDAQNAPPGEEGAGAVLQGFVEGSNVRMVDEILNLMLAQRAYQASVKVVQTADEMLGMINNLRK